MRRLTWVPALALALSFATCARAATDADLDEIRAQIRELKSSYEARIRALERRLKDAEEKAAQPAAPSPVDPAPAPVAAAPSPGGGGSGGGLSAFNPAVSVVSRDSGPEATPVLGGAGSASGNRSSRSSPMSTTSSPAP